MHHRRIENQLVARLPVGPHRRPELLLALPVLRADDGVVRLRRQHDHRIEPELFLQPPGPVPHIRKGRMLRLAPRLQHNRPPEPSFFRGLLRGERNVRLERIVQIALSFQGNVENDANEENGEYTDSLVQGIVLWETTNRPLGPSPGFG